MVMKMTLNWFAALTFLVIALSSFPCCKKGIDEQGKSVEVDFIVEEATIADIHKAFKKGQLTSRQLVDH